LLGVVASLVAAIIPALEAMSSSAVQVLSRSNLERRARARVPWLAALGVLFLAAGGMLSQVATRSLIAGLGVVAIVTIGFALMIPGASVVAVRLLQPPMKFLMGPLGTMACRGVTGSLSRTGVALAALAVAISMTVGIDIMVGSFRDSIARAPARPMKTSLRGQG
jgi:putative ABC transport system permease protein